MKGQIKLKRIVSFVLIMIMLAGALFGCGNDTVETGTDAATGTNAAETKADTETAGVQTDAETAAAEPEINDPKDVKIGGAPLSDFAVVIAKEPNSTVKNAADDLCRLIAFATGYELPLKPGVLLVHLFIEQRI